MADDIVTRLRRSADEMQWEMLLARALQRAAADEIERLRAQVLDMDRRIVTLIGEHQALAIAYASAVTHRG